MAFDRESFLAGLAMGRQMKGWAAVAGDGDSPLYAEDWDAVPFWEWARRNGAPWMFLSAEAYQDFAASLPAPTVDQEGGSYIPLSLTTLSLYCRYPSRSGPFQGSIQEHEGYYTILPASAARLQVYALTLTCDASYEGSITPLSVPVLYDVSTGQAYPIEFNNVQAHSWSRSGQSQRVETAAYSTVYRLEFPVLARFQPSVPLESAESYGPASRPASILGAFGTVTEEGEIVRYTAASLVTPAEDQLILPMTGETLGIAQWVYDYAARSYTLTLADGGEASVTYGEQEAVIQREETVWRVQYLARTGT